MLINNTNYKICYVENKGYILIKGQEDNNDSYFLTHLFKHSYSFYNIDTYTKFVVDKEGNVCMCNYDIRGNPHIDKTLDNVYFGEICKEDIKFEIPKGYSEFVVVPPK